MMFVILLATESSPSGKITRDAEVLICFHFKEEGLPPKICENPLKEKNNKNVKKKPLNM